MRRLMIALLALAILLSGCSIPDNSLSTATDKPSPVISDEPNESAEVETPAFADSDEPNEPVVVETPVSTEPFDPLLYSGNGDKIITDINLPNGIFISTIEINSTAHYDVEFHHDDTYELLVNNSREPYSGVTLIKDSEIDAISGGMLEITSDGNWKITVDRLSGETTKNIVGHGDRVTGFFLGSGKKEVVTLDVDSTAHYDIRLFEYNAVKNTLTYDLLINDSREPYHGEKIADLKEGLQYFFVVNSEGDWSIDFGTGDDVTEYYDISTSEYSDAKIDTSTVESAYNEACNLSIDDLERKTSSMTGTVFYNYNGLIIQPEDSEFLTANWNTDKCLDKGALYRSVASYLEGFFSKLNNGSDYSELLCGKECSSREEFKPYAENASEFIVSSKPIVPIMKALEKVSCVSGEFDYDNDNMSEYDFVIADLTACAEELKISEKMLGYILANLSEYTATITFDGNSCHIKSLEW